MKTSYREEIAAYRPENDQEAADQQAMLWYIDHFGDNVLTRKNQIAHITSSGFLMNPSLDKALLIHHNIRDTWAWTGGHADGDNDLLAVAVREAMEETGAEGIRPLAETILSIDILPVYPHWKRGVMVNTHLHLSVAYVLLCEEDQLLRIKPDENTGVQWFDAEQIASPQFDRRDVALYKKLMRRARQLARV